MKIDVFKFTLWIKKMLYTITFISRVVVYLIIVLFLNYFCWSSYFYVWKIQYIELKTLLIQLFWPIHCTTDFVYVKIFLTDETSTFCQWYESAINATKFFETILLYHKTVYDFYQIYRRYVRYWQLKQKPKRTVKEYLVDLCICFCIRIKK